MQRSDRISLVLLGALVLVAGWLAYGAFLNAPRVAEDPAAAIAAPLGVHDPTETGVELPPGYRTVLRRDAIRPIYAPVYRSAEDTDWPDGTLVLGVELDGDARAYPINVLNRRELVVDVIGDIPVLASW